MEIPVLNEIMRDTVVEVDLDRIAFNVRQIKLWPVRAPRWRQW